MQSREEAQHDEAQKLFEKLLKRSRHFADATNTQRAATAEVIAAFAAAFIGHDETLAPIVTKTLQSLQILTGRPSVDAERQILTRDALLALTTGKSPRPNT